MPLTLKSPFAFLGRRRSSSEVDQPRSSSSSGGAAARKNSVDRVQRSGSNLSAGADNLTSGSTATAGGSRSSRTRPGGEMVKVTVPDNAKPGETIRVRAADGRLIEIDLPPGTTPGKTLTIEIDGFKSKGSKSSGSSLSELAVMVKSTLEATQSRCNFLRERLREELELQRGLWASANSAQQSIGQRQMYGQDMNMMLMPAATLDELSQTQALVFAAADVGDGKQLLAALQEARQFSTVHRSLEECVNSLNSAEEAMVTYRCLLDAIHAQNRHEMEVWVEQARALNLEVPGDFTTALEAMKRQEEDSLQRFARHREVEQKLQFAMEAGDPELLKEVVLEAESVGLNSRVAIEAANKVRGMNGSRNRASSSEPIPSEPKIGASRKSNQLPRSVSGDSQTPSTAKAPCWRPAPPESQRGSNGAKREESPPPLFPKVEPEEPMSFQSGPEAGAGGPSFPTGRQSASYSGTGQVPDTDPRTVKELLEECRRLGIDTAGCTDKQDLLRILVNRPKAPAPDNPPPKDTPSYTSGQDRSSSKASRPQPSQPAYTGFASSGSAGYSSSGSGYSQSAYSGRTGFSQSTSSDYSGSQSHTRTPTSTPTPTKESSTRPTSSTASTSQSGQKTVWDRRYPPPHLLTKRSKALWVLGLDPYASPSASDLRSAYRKAAMESHPDRAQNHTREAQAKELFQQVKDAFDHLSKS